jgi:mucin-19
MPSRTLPRHLRTRSSLSRRRLRIERLEDRRMLAITAFFDGVTDSLTFTGDAGDNQLTILASDPSSTTVSFTSTDGPITLLGATTNPQAGVTLILVNLAGGTGDSLTIAGSGGADTIALNGLIATYAAVPYALLAVENLIIAGQGGGDTISATGASVTGDLVLNGGADADTLSANNLTVGDFTVQGPDTDDIDLSGAITAATGSQHYQTPVTIAGATTLTANTAGQRIEFDGTVNGANSLVMTSPESIFDGAVGAIPLASLTTVGLLGEVRINGGQVTTTGSQTYAGPVTLNSPTNATTLTSTAGSVIFAATLNSLQLNEENLSIDAAVDTIFVDVVGTAPNGALASLTTNSNTGNGAGTTRMNAGTVLTIGNQAYQENVTLNGCEPHRLG